VTPDAAAQAVTTQATRGAGDDEKVGEAASPPLISELDRERFGVAIARATLSGASNVARYLVECRRGAVAMAIVRTEGEDTAAIHELERAGGLLCDTLVYYGRLLATRSAMPGDVFIRDASPADVDQVGDVAAAAFAGYGGHYQADPRLDRDAADATYVDWARRSCAGGADRVWVAEADGRVVGFLALRVNAPDETEIVLNAVHPDYQRRGIYRDLVMTALAASRELGAERCIVSTQLTNVAVQRAWTRLGFEIVSSLQTFHVWLDA
jgi:ribosomal protein S18 acetylase RimI-like enzyme